METGKEIIERYWETKGQEHDKEVKELKEAISKQCIKGEGLFAVLQLDYTGYKR